MDDNQDTKLLFPWKIYVFSIILLIPFVLPAALFSPILVLSGLLILIVNGGKIKISYLKNVAPLFAIVIIGCIGMSNHSSHHILRDITYALTPLSLIYIGYYYCESRITLQQILKIIMLFALIFSLIHLFQFLINPSLLLEQVDTIRQNSFNPAGELVTFSLILGLIQYRLGLDNLFPRFLPRFIGLPILFLSFVFLFSRISFVVAIALFLSFMGFLSRINWKSIVSIGILLTGLLFLILTTPSYETNTFRGKISKSITEITISDYQNFADINHNWRGYETFRALLDFSKQGIVGKIIGSGFGSVVDLGLSIQLGSSYLREIPIFHNGYAYILVKTGLIGLFCYVLFYFNIIQYAFKLKKTENAEQFVLSLLLLGLALSMILSMYVVGGIAEIHDTAFLLLSGFILRRLEIIS